MNRKRIVRFGASTALLFALLVATVLANSTIVTVPSGASWFNYSDFRACSGSGGNTWQYDGEAGSIAVTPGQQITINNPTNTGTGYQFTNSSGSQSFGGGFADGGISNPGPCGGD